VRKQANSLFFIVILGSCGPRLDYPMGQNEIRELLEHNRLPELRRHGWKVLETVIRPGANGLPLFRSWDELDQVFPSGTKLHSLEPGLRFTLPAELAQPGKAIITSIDPSCDTIPCQLVYFNPSTVRGLNRQVMEDGFVVVPRCSDSLYKLNEHLGTTPIEKRDIPGFATDSIVVKSLWVIMNSAATKRVSLYDPPTVRRASNSPSLWATWPSCVGVKATPELPAGEASDCKSFADIGEFYHFELDEQTVQTYTSEAFRNSIPVASHTYALLLGMHVTTREIPEWVWATFWWGDRSPQHTYSKDKPGSLARLKPWNNYAMDVAYDMNRPHTAEGVPKICFNPFLEGQIVDGSVSNCMTCHRRAGINVSNPGAIFRGEISLDDSLAFNDPHQTVRTDFLWSPVIHGTNCGGSK
jgi:hypothetical protein